jgi:hypothetical protein
MRSVSDEVTAAVDRLDAKLGDSLECGVKGLRIRVYVSYDCDGLTHGRSSRLLGRDCRAGMFTADELVDERSEPGS